MSTVKLPAEAEAYKVQTIAEGKRYEYFCSKLLLKINQFKYPNDCSEYHTLSERQM